MNFREAAKWYEKAEEQGEEWAAYRLAHMYRNVSPRSPEKAELWERKGNELRHGDDFRSHSSRNVSNVFSRVQGGGVWPSIDNTMEIEAGFQLQQDKAIRKLLLQLVICMSAASVFRPPRDGTTGQRNEVTTMRLSSWHGSISTEGAYCATAHMPSSYFVVQQIKEIFERSCNSHGCTKTE